MRKRLMALIIVSLPLCSAFGQATVLPEESVSTLPTAYSSMKEETKQGSYLLENRRFRDIFTGGSYSSVEEMRLDRRVGIGVETFGRLGMMGVDLELNFSPFTSALVGVGGGSGYQSISLGGKHVFGGQRVSPYASFSLVRWSGRTQSGVDGSYPGFLADKFLTESERESGRFGKDFFVPAAGLQFNQLEGEKAGAVLFAEVLFLIEASTMARIPTGALGAMYFF